MEHARGVGVRRTGHRRRRAPGPIITGLAALLAVDAVVLAVEALFR